MPPDTDLASTAPALVDTTVLVTGGAGFVGSHLVEALVAGCDVRVLDDCSTGRAENVHPDATLHRGDVTDPATLATAVDGADHVFHLAAVSSVPDSMAAPTRCLSVNGTGTASVLERARHEGARVVVASSAAVYGTPASTPVSEDDPTTPESPYGQSKLLADGYVRGYDDWFDVPGVALRLFNVYGPRQPAGRGVVSTFVDAAGAGEELVVHGDGEQTRDFVHVDDVVRAFCRAATADVSGVAVNVGTGEATSVRDLARIVAERADPSVEVVHAEPRPGDVRHSRADTTAARDLLAFEAEWSLSDGIAAMLA